VSIALSKAGAAAISSAVMLRVSAFSPVVLAVVSLEVVPVVEPAVV
jgi:hypothetical protein